MQTLHYILDEWQKQLAGLPVSAFTFFNGLILIAAIFIPMEWKLGPLIASFREPGLAGRIARFCVLRVVPGALFIVGSIVGVDALATFIQAQFPGTIWSELFRSVAASTKFEKALPGIVIAEILLLNPKFMRRKGLMRDIGHYFVNNLVPPALVVVFTVAVILVLHRFIPKAVLDWSAGLTLWPRFFIAMVLSDLGSYWAHRWMHEIPYLWRFHAVHHAAEEMDWLVNTRAHILDISITRAGAFVPLYAFGLAQVSADHIDALPFFVSLATRLWGYFIHADVKWRFGPLEWLVATPAFHHWHHTNDGPDKINKNYAANLPLMDILFGTHYRSKTMPEKYGINEHLPESLIGQTLHPFLPKSRSRNIGPKG